MEDGMPIVYSIIQFIMALCLVFVFWTCGRYYNALQKKEEVSEYTCSDEFKEFVKTLSQMELVLIIHDLKQQPEDKEYLLAAQLRLGELCKGKPNEPKTD